MLGLSLDVVVGTVFCSLTFSSLFYPGDQASNAPPVLVRHNSGYKSIGGTADGSIVSLGVVGG